MGLSFPEPMKRGQNRCAQSLGPSAANAIISSITRAISSREGVIAARNCTRSIANWSGS